MSSKLQPSKVERWAHSEPGTEIEAEVAEAFRALAEEEPLDQATLAAVGRRIAQQAKPASRRPFRHLPLVLAMLTFGTGAAFAQLTTPEIWSLQQLFVPRPKQKVEAVPAGKPRANNVATPSAAPLVGNEPTAAALPPEPTPAPSVIAEIPAPLAPSAVVVPRPSQLAQESELLQRALAKLRRDHDAAATLALLDDYSTRFPRGVLALEASVARVDALLLAGRRADALARLTQMPLDQVGRGIELRLLRAELYGERDCNKALSDFAAVLAAGASGGLGERALYGRATCRIRLGDAAGGQADLQAYLSRYPQGRFSDQIRMRISAP